METSFFLLSTLATLIRCGEGGQSIPDMLLAHRLLYDSIVVCVDEMVLLLGDSVVIVNGNFISSSLISYISINSGCCFFNSFNCLFPASSTCSESSPGTESCLWILEIGGGTALVGDDFVAVGLLFA